jgi:hypothetical protein
VWPREAPFELCEQITLAEFVVSRKQKRQQDAGATGTRDDITQPIQYGLGKSLSRRNHGLLCGVEGRLQEAPGIFTGVSPLEYGTACDQNFSPCAHDICDGVVMDAPVNFNAEAEPARLPGFREQFNLLQGREDKGLATETWVHAHDENMVDQGKNFVERLDRCGRVNYHSGLTSMCCDQMKGAIQMDAGFLVDGDPIGTRFCKCGDKLVRSFNHEVTIERNFRDFAKRGQDRWSDGDIGDEVAIHHVDVEDGGAPCDSSLGFCAEASEVSGKDGGSELDHRILQLAARA